MTKTDRKLAFTRRKRTKSTQRLFLVVICDMLYYYPTATLGLGSGLLDDYDKGCLVTRQPVSPFTKHPVCPEPLQAVQGTPQETRLPLRGAELSLQWPETHGHAKARRTF